MKEDGIKTVIAKLMTLAMDPRTPIHEADTARQKAAKLMAKHQIDIASVKTLENGFASDMIEVQTELFYYGSQRDMKWEGYLSNGIRRNFDCNALLTYDENGDNVISFMGHSKDVELVLYFFNYLQSKIASMIKGKYHTQKDSNSYARGLVSNVSKRLAEMYKEMESALPADVTALVVRKKEDAQAFMDGLYPPRSIVKSRRQAVNWELHAKGIKDGGKIPLNEAVGQDSRKNLE